MPYFHVLIETASQVGDFECVAKDLSEGVLKKQVVRPYKNGVALILGGRIVPIGELRGIKITETEEPSGSTLSRATKSFNESIEHLNAEPNSHVVILPFFGYGPDALEQFGKDVTAKYISRAPGQGGIASLIWRVFNHPWVAGIGAAVMASGVAAWLKWN